ncbi:MAG: hypothetical protein AABY10_06100 [Nanoarchaeota archaeon]
MNSGNYKYTEQEIDRNLRDTNIYEEPEIKDFLKRLRQGNDITPFGNLKLFVNTSIILTCFLPIIYLAESRLGDGLAGSFTLFTLYWGLKNVCYNHESNNDFLDILNKTAEHQRQVMSGRSLSDLDNNQGLDKLLGDSR